MLGLSLSRLNSLASRLGIASPVTLLVTKMSIDDNAMPADAVALTVISSNKSSACFWKEAVRSSQLCGLRYQSSGSQL